MSTGRLPRWLKLGYSLWLAVWIPAYWIAYGPVNFLWLCDVANLVVAAAVWRDSALLMSSQAVGVLLIQIAWLLDVAGRLLLGFHPIGGTEYMFEAGRPLALRLLSLFHLVMPVLLLWAVDRLGYDRRGWRLQTMLTWLVLPLSFFLAEPEANVNWLWRPFGVPQTLVSPALWLVLSMLLYPLLLYLPTHAGLLAWSRRRGRLLPRAVRSGAPGSE